MGGFTFDLTGRTALVTGASSGLGARFARILAASGANVVLAARREALLERVERDIRGDGGRAISVAMDVTAEESVRAAYDAAKAAFGPVDTVIANAGIAITPGAIDIEASDFDGLLAVNVRGVFLTAREGARRMIAAGSGELGNGRIVLISSILAHHISAGTAPYSASKAAVIQLGRVLSRDWASSGINVNTLCPGYVGTEMNASWRESDKGKRQIQSWPRGRLMDEDALDAIILYLSSDASRFVTGSEFTIDDGQTL